MSTFGTGTYAAAPAHSLVYGGFWIRVVAYIIDAILMNIVIWLGLMALGGPGMMAVDPQTGTIPPGFWSFMAISTLLPAIYVIGFWINAGATPGKMAFGLRIVGSETGAPLTAGQAIGRFFGYIISSIVFCLGFIWVGFDARKQGWHDKLAGTVVVRRRGSDVPTFRT